MRGQSCILSLCMQEFENGHSVLSLEEQGEGSRKFDNPYYTLWHCCPGTAWLSPGTPGLETKGRVPGFPEAEMTNAFVKLSPCVAEEENDVQTCFPGRNGAILVNLHTSPCPSQLRGRSGSKASWVVSSGSQLPHDAAWFCQLNCLEKFRQAMGNTGKNKHETTETGFLL